MYDRLPYLSYIYIRVNIVMQLQKLNVNLIQNVALKSVNSLYRQIEKTAIEKLKLKSLIFDSKESNQNG